MSAGQTEIARAKVNLTLHVGAVIPSGKWTGYHPVESLVVFADFGDELTFTPAKTGTMAFGGIFGDALGGQEGNSISQALKLCGAPPQNIHVDKQIPIAAGLGGGTADAAAVLRCFDVAGRVDPVELGADGPVCHLSRTAMMEGIGEAVTPVEGLGQLSAVLINPGIAISTGAIFKAMDAAPRGKDPAQTIRHGDLLSRALSGENDMQAAAMFQAPIISDVLRALAQQPSCELARMSGSGATCFGLFRSDAQAGSAAKAISAAHPNWWVRPCRLGDPIS